jgi:hypothetical protein
MNHKVLPTKPTACAILVGCSIRSGSRKRANWIWNITPSLVEGLMAGFLQFLRMNYGDLCTRVRQGGSDNEILEWCFTHGRRWTENDVTIWNGFISKLGWNDAATSYLAKCKKEAGLSHRDDIQTLSQLFDVEEGRKP